jgi:hypothetical protein
MHSHDRSGKFRTSSRKWFDIRPLRATNTMRSANVEREAGRLLPNCELSFLGLNSCNTSDKPPLLAAARILPL